MPTVPRISDRFFVGHLPQVRPGFVFKSQKALKRSGVHRGGAIVGNEARGACSLVLSEYSSLHGDDGGIGFTYEEPVGAEEEEEEEEEEAEAEEGGSGSGSASGIRAWLLASYARKQPVRVLRSSRHPSRRYRAPRGYRYDGLYEISRHWREGCLHRFRFELRADGCTMADGSVLVSDGGHGPWDCPKMVTVSRKRPRRLVPVGEE